MCYNLSWWLIVHSYVAKKLLGVLRHRSRTTFMRIRLRCTLILGTWPYIPILTCFMCLLVVLVMMDYFTVSYLLVVTDGYRLPAIKPPNICNNKSTFVHYELLSSCTPQQTLDQYTPSYSYMLFTLDNRLQLIYIHYSDLLLLIALKGRLDKYWETLRHVTLCQ